MRTIAIVIAAALASIAVAAVCLMAPGYYAYLLGMLATTALAGIGLNVLLGLAGEVYSVRPGFWRSAPMASESSRPRPA